MQHLHKWFSTKKMALILGLSVLGLISVSVFWFSEHRSPEKVAQNYYEHGVKLAEYGDYTKAALEFRNAIRLNKNFLAAWRGVAQIEETQQKWADLIRSLQSILSLDPADVSTRIKLIKLLVLSGRVYQALELINSENEPDGQNAQILGLKAGILFKLNDKLGAVREAQKALAIDPGSADALVVLATDRMVSGDLKGALQILEGNTSASTTDLGIQLLKLKIFEQLRETRPFELLLQRLAESYPKDGLFRRHLIKFYLDQRRTGEAEKEARQLVQENPANPQAELDLVRLLYAVKGPTAARDELVARISAGGEVFPYQIALADFDFSQGKFAEAEHQIQNLVSSGSSRENIITAKIMLAELALKKDKIDVAERIASEILSDDGRNTNALKVRASVRIVRGQFDLAITDLQQALGDQPRSTQLILLLALAYERKGSMALADKQYSDAVRISNFNSNVGLNYVNFLLRRGNVDRAEQFLVELSKRSPESLDVLSALAQVELGRGNWDGARAVSESIRNISSSRGIADQFLGAALLGQNRYDESIAVFQSLVSAEPSAVQPMISLVRALVRAQKTESALAFLKSVLTTNPDNAEAQVLIGSLQLATGARDQALQSFKLAIDKQPKNVVGYHALANLYSGENRIDEALAAIRSGLEMQPDSVTLRLALAEVLEQTDQYEAAMNEYELILKRQPGLMVAANNLASLLSDHRNDKASLEKAQTLAASLRETQVPQFKDTLGWISYRRGDYVNAVSLLEKAVVALPNMPLIRYHLAMSYFEVGQNAKALEQLNAAISLSPNTGLRDKIQQALSKLANL